MASELSEIEKKTWEIPFMKVYKDKNLMVHYYHYLFETFALFLSCLPIYTLLHHEYFLIFLICVMEFEMGSKVNEYYWDDRKDEELRVAEMSFIIHKIINLWRLHSICNDDITWLYMMNFLEWKLNLKVFVHCKMCIGLIFYWNCYAIAQCHETKQKIFTLSFYYKYLVVILLSTLS